VRPFFDLCGQNHVKTWENPSCDARFPVCDGGFRVATDVCRPATGIRPVATAFRPVVTPFRRLATAKTSFLNDFLRMTPGRSRSRGDFFSTKFLTRANSKS